MTEARIDAYLRDKTWDRVRNWGKEDIILGTIHILREHLTKLILVTCHFTQKRSRFFGYMPLMSHLLSSRRKFDSKE